MAGGADKTSLVEAQRNDQDFGARDRQGLPHVRPPAADEPLDPAWRPIDPSRESFEEWEAEQCVPWPQDRSRLC
ncbi:CPCC family cysteine-rich protein [Streptomyces sp. NPDC005262]|uniref:CPCC family cysteine-rich protein n=1 Tax=Streptomyces sp. NPDC005262 TaxID=3364710 RepID=UPI0036C722D0